MYVCRLGSPGGYLLLLSRRCTDRNHARVDSHESVWLPATRPMTMIGCPASVSIVCACMALPGTASLIVLGHCAVDNSHARTLPLPAERLPPRGGSGRPIPPLCAVPGTLVSLSASCKTRSSLASEHPLAKAARPQPKETGSAL